MNKTTVIKIIPYEENGEKIKRKYEIFSGKTKVINLDVISSPVTNKFHKIIDFIHDISDKLGKNFDIWFVKFIKSYYESGYYLREQIDKKLEKQMKIDVKDLPEIIPINSDHATTAEYAYILQNKLHPSFDSTILRNNLDEMIAFCDKYTDKCNVAFNNYIRKERVSKTSIFFDAEEIEKLIRTSNYLKIYFFITQDKNMKPPIKVHKEIYNYLVNDISTCEIVYKLFKLVSSKTYRYNISDKTMWDYFKLIYCQTTDMHISSIFNFIMNNILVTCDTNMNPIPYFSSVIDESIRWMLHRIYKESVIYSDTINTEDIHTISGKDNLLSYCYNDAIGKLVANSTNYLESVGIVDIPKFNNNVSNLKDQSLMALYITYPILNKVLEIPYRYFRPIPPDHSYLLNILTYFNLSDEFKAKYKLIAKLLTYYNIEKPIVKTTYKIKNTEHFHNSFDSFIGFSNSSFAYNVLSELIGKIARNTYVSFIDDKQIANFPLHDLEKDMISFYNNYFSNGFEDEFEKMIIEIEKNM